jgi:hypothetical protein
VESGQYIVVRVAPDGKAYTYWVVDPPGGIKLKADGLPVEPENVYAHRTASAAGLGAAIQAEMPELIGPDVSPIPGPGTVEISSGLQGNGTIQIGVGIRPGIAAQLFGDGELDTSAALLAQIRSPLSGGGDLAVPAWVIQQILATNGGAGVLWADVSSSPGPQQIFATLVGLGGILADSTLVGQLALSMAGTGSINALAVLREAISKTFTGTGTLTASVDSHPGGIAIGATLSGFGAIVGNEQTGTIFNVNASVSGNNVTVTANTSVNLQPGNKVFGVEFKDGPGGAPYTSNKNTPGVQQNQSITIGAADGVVLGHTLSYRAYYNLTGSDPASSRNYGGADPRTVDVPSNSVNITAALSGVGSLSTGTVSGLYNVNATESLGSVTVTALSTVDLSNGRYGVEYRDGAGTDYTRSKNIAGGVSNQSITISPQDDVVSGHTLSYRTYYNLTELDPYDTRVYGPAGTIAVP